MSQKIYYNFKLDEIVLLTNKINDFDVGYCSFWFYCSHNFYYLDVNLADLVEIGEI
jgi:hypothetical protein